MCFFNQLHIKHMDKKIIIAVVIAAAVIGLGSFLFLKKPAPMRQSADQQGAYAPGTTTQPAPATPARTITITLSSQNNSGESGTATLTDVNGKTGVVLALTGAPSGVTQPAHIHTGSCAAIGGVVYPLTFPVNGKSETTLNVTIDELLKKLPLALNVHKSAAEANVYVACGDIMNTNTASQSAPAVNQPAANTPPAAVNDNRTGGGAFSTPNDNRKGATKPEN